MLFAEASTSGLRGRRQRKDRRAMGLLQLLDRNRDLFGQYGHYGWIVVPANWWFLSVSPWLSIGGGLLVISGLSLMAPPVGIATARTAALVIFLASATILDPFDAGC